MIETHWVFVFGSNLAGIHGAGAAKVAKDVYDYPPKMAFGMHTSDNLQEAFAIPTKDGNIITLPLTYIEYFVEEFKSYVKQNNQKSYFVTRIGCGLAGYNDADIAPLFRGDYLVSANISFAEEWEKYLR